MEHNQFHLRVGEQTVGPFTIDQVRQWMAANGASPEDAQVWDQSNRSWRPLPELLAGSKPVRHASPSRYRGNRLPYASGLVAVALLVAVTGGLTAALWIFWPRAIDPNEISQEMMPALMDIAAVERAERCLDLVSNRDAFNAGKPYKIIVVAESINACKVVSETLPDSTTFGGYTPSSYGDCDELKKEHPKSAARHENNLKAKIGLFCGENEQPTLEPDASVELGAQAMLRDRLPKVVRGIADGTLSPKIQDCYFSVKHTIAAVAEKEREHRCAIMTADFEAPGITYDAIWTHARIRDRFEEYKREHQDAWLKAEKDVDTTSLLNEFTEEAKRKACEGGEEAELISTQRAATITAAATCL